MREEAIRRPNDVCLTGRNLAYLFRWRSMQLYLVKYRWYVYQLHILAYEPGRTFLAILVCT